VLDENHRAFLEAIESSTFETVRADDPNWLIALHCSRRKEIDARGSQKLGFLDEIRLNKFGKQVLELEHSIQKNKRKRNVTAHVLYWLYKTWDTLNTPLIASLIAAVLAGIILAYVL
jgi:hypothetical protein